VSQSRQNLREETFAEASLANIYVQQFETIALNNEAEILRIEFPFQSISRGFSVRALLRLVNNRSCASDCTFRASFTIAKENTSRKGVAKTCPLELVQCFFPIMTLGKAKNKTPSLSWDTPQSCN